MKRTKIRHIKLSYARQQGFLLKFVGMKCRHRKSRRGSKGFFLGGRCDYICEDEIAELLIPISNLLRFGINGELDDVTALGRGGGSGSGS